MLRVNISTRPFYNERGVHLFLALIGLVLLGLAVFNASALVRLSARETELTARTSKEEARARELRQEAVKLRGSIKQEELDAVLAAAREANGLIDLRTFSWTALFNSLEETLPPDVMLTFVRPVVESGRVTVNIGVIGQRVDAIDQFMTRLEETKTYRDVLSRDEVALEDGSGYEATLVAVYAPGETPAPAGDSPGGAAPRGQAAP